MPEPIGHADPVHTGAGLESLIEEYRRPLLGRIRLMMGDRARRAAESGDFLHDVFATALGDGTRATLPPEQDLLRWLTAIARNRIRAEVRRDHEGRFRTLSDSLSGKSSSPTPSTEAARQEQLVELAEALEQLPDDYRDVIQRRHFEELPFAAIGRLMGRSEEAARKLHTRALLRVGDSLKQS